VSPSRCRRSVFFSKQQRTRILGCRCASRHHRAIRKDRHEAGLAMKYKCSSASSCSQKRHTWPLRSEGLRAVSSGAVRIAACVPFYPMTTTRGEKPHAKSLPSLPCRHIRHLRSISRTSVPPGDIRPGSLPLSHFTVNPIRLEMATLIKKPQILTAQQFILRLLHLRPLTVVVQDSQDGNGICNGNMPSKSEPHGRTFCHVLKKPSRFLWRPPVSIKAFLRRLKDASMPQTHVGAPRSGAPFLWVDGCRQLLVRHGK